jgi:prevent-host-death family protein
MKRTLSIVEARRKLGRVAEEVSRTGQPVVLTRRGKPVARITPEPRRAEKKKDLFGELRGSIRLNCTFAELQREIRKLRRDFVTGPHRLAQFDRLKGG